MSVGSNHGTNKCVWIRRPRDIDSAASEGSTALSIATARLYPHPSSRWKGFLEERLSWARLLRHIRRAQVAAQ
jgi:hypothetical protein